MIFTLIAGFGVGVFFDRASRLIADALGRAGVTLEEDVLKLTSLVLCLAAAAVALMLIGVHAYPALLCLGGAMGVARAPLLARITGSDK